jgi:hypothetical protein
MFEVPVSHRTVMCAEIPAKAKVIEPVSLYTATNTPKTAKPSPHRLSYLR